MKMEANKKREGAGAPIDDSVESPRATGGSIRQPGNTQIPVVDTGNDRGSEPMSQKAEKKKSSYQRVHHFFTFNNYDEEDIICLEKVFQEYCYMYVFQEEVSKSGTPHLQGTCCCKKKQYDTIFGFKRIHWETVVCLKDSLKYCSAKWKRKEGGRIWSLNFTVEHEFEIINMYDWQLELSRKLAQPPDDRTVMWYYSHEGKTGKSTFTKHCILNLGAVFLSKGKYGDIINIIYKSTIKNIVVIDIPRNSGNFVSYDAIESIKNGMICNTKFETGYKIFQPPHVLIFSNDYPQVEKLSEDRWDIVEIPCENRVFESDGEE